MLFGECALEWILCATKRSACFQLEIPSPVCRIRAVLATEARQVLRYIRFIGETDHSLS